ncbi:unnamed protein product [Absidia cylindrospora]
MTSSHTLFEIMPQLFLLRLFLYQNRQWPRSGPEILAQYDDDTIVVYMETSKVVAAQAMETQDNFRWGATPLRVYTSFIRSQASFEWSSKFDSPEKLMRQHKNTRCRRPPKIEPRRRRKKKRNSNEDDDDDDDDKFEVEVHPQQRHTLAVRIRRSTFDQWIENAQLMDSESIVNAGDNLDPRMNYIERRYPPRPKHYWPTWWGWRYPHGVAYRWVNDIYPELPLNGAAPHQRLARKTLELFLFSNAVAVFIAPKTVLSVEDITPFVNEIRARLTHHKQSNVKDIWSPSERPYVPSTDRILE